MRRYGSLEGLLAELGSAPKWQGVGVALRTAPRVLKDVTWSVGSSVTYRVTEEPDQPGLTGHRRYLEARAVLEGSLVVQVAPCADLLPASAYDDLTDRQAFAGEGAVHELRAGEVLVVDADEAVWDAEVEGTIVVLRVTVEPPAPERTRSATAP